MIKYAFLVLTIGLGLAGCGLISDRAFDGPLAKHPDAQIFGFAQQPPLQDNSSDVLRMLIAPSFGQYHYRFDFKPMAKSCRVFDPSRDRIMDQKTNFCGNIMVDAERITMTDKNVSQPGSVRFQFVVPSEDFRPLFNGLKHRIGRWNFSFTGLTDGTSIAVEQHSSGTIKSYHSNAVFELSPDDPAAFASQFAHALALAYAPSGLIPKSADWTVDEKIDPQYGCSPAQLNLPDFDGFGVGDDACAKTLSRK